MKNYKQLSEDIYSKWVNTNLVIEDNFGFDLDALPEPYISFGDNSREVAFLTTNPGSVMDFQNRESVFLNDIESYAKVSERLGVYYEEHLIGSSRTRIETMDELFNLLKN